MITTYTVISFGNYETKILVSNFINGRIYPIYKRSFLTKICFENSIIVDSELLLKALKDEIRKIPININNTILIFNLPIKNLIIVDEDSNDLIINGQLTIRKWNKIFNDTKINKTTKDKLELDLKLVLIKADSNNYIYIPLQKHIEKLSYKTRHYLIDKNYINEYFKIAKSLNLNVKLFTCDSLVIHNLFKNAERKKKLLINIGHGETSFELYDNLILTYQKTYTFGIKNLTSNICDEANIDEITSIELLKIYKDLSPIDIHLPLVNHFKEKFLDYSQTKIEDISALIKQWMDKLIEHINEHVKLLSTKNIEINEIYIYSPTNIFNSWIEYIKKKLLKFSDVICLESSYFGVNESKFLSLIATMLHFDKEYKKDM